MRIDKQIFDLPQADAKFLQAQLALGTKVSAILQVNGYDLDFQIDLNLLISLITNNSQSILYSGASVPDNAIGKNGDIYKQTNGKIYLKSGNAWQLLNNNPQPFTEFITFTYDGTNNTVPLAFAPNTAGMAILNTLPLNPFKDYKISGKNLIISSDLLYSGISYNLNILYFK